MTNPFSKAGVTQREAQATVTARKSGAAVAELQNIETDLYIRTGETQTLETNTTLQRVGAILEPNATGIQQPNSTLIVRPRS